MYESDQLDIWNLTPGGVARTGAQPIFNVVGRVHDLATFQSLTVRLNDGAPCPVVVNTAQGRSGRLHRPGDFCIDTIATADLQPHNTLTLHLHTTGGHDSTHAVTFNAAPFPPADRQFALDLDGVTEAEQVGQVVDGRWTIERDAAGEPCLAIRREDAGYDRIITFGHADWTTSYAVRMRFSVTEWTGAVHLAGVLFKWQPHTQGDGTVLPKTWTCGLGYYASNTPGLRIHYGLGMDAGPDAPPGREIIVGEAPYSALRRRLWQLQFGGRRTKRYGRERLPLPLPTAQLQTGVQYWLKLIVAPEKHALAVWPVGQKERAAQVLAVPPGEPLATGSVGAIFYHCAARCYEFTVEPV